MYHRDMPRPQQTRGLTEEFGYGRGYDEIVKGITPAAGAQFSYKIQGQYSTRLLSIIFTIVTDANVANRAVTVDFADPEDSVWASNGYGAVITASTTQKHSGQIDRTVGEWASGTTIFFPISDLFIDPGNKIRINVANIQATDALSAIVMVLERFPTGNRGYPEGAVTPRARR